MYVLVDASKFVNYLFYRFLCEYRDSTHITFILLKKNHIYPNKHTYITLYTHMNIHSHPYSRTLYCLQIHSPTVVQAQLLLCPRYSIPTTCEILHHIIYI